MKAKSPLCCSEPQHTRGAKIKGSLMRSMPICEACIIKASFGKRDDNTYPNRARSLCAESFKSGNPHQETLLSGERIVLNSYLMCAEYVCIARDGHLCLKCKTKQNSKLDLRKDQCYGIGCLKSKLDGCGGCVYLRCDLPLPRERNRCETFTPTHSSYNQTLGKVAEDDVIDPTEQEAV